MSAKMLTGLIVDAKNIPITGFGFIKPDVGDENTYITIYVLEVHACRLN
jgi:hypothetical protein